MGAKTPAPTAPKAEQFLEFRWKIKAPVALFTWLGWFHMFWQHKSISFSLFTWTTGTAKSCRHDASYPRSLWDLCRGQTLCTFQQTFRVLACLIGLAHRNQKSWGTSENKHFLSMWREVGFAHTADVKGSLSPDFGLGEVFEKIKHSVILTSFYALRTRQKSGICFPLVWCSFPH